VQAALAEDIGGTAVAGDLTDPATDAKILKAIGRGGLAGLVNNAGIFRRLGFADSDERDWRDQFELNLFAAVRVTKSLLPKLKAHGAGSIVNISSTAGARAVAGMSAYSATKAALNNWTQTLALELAPDIRVNAISPGLVDTPLHSFTTKQKNDLKTAQPLGRIGQPEDIATAALFLFESAWITGVILPVDGGISLT
ncbi:MAG: SDR family oxidoreductase, partial [Bdellovibrionia bacterium]